MNTSLSFIKMFFCYYKSLCWYTRGAHTLLLLVSCPINIYYKKCFLLLFCCSTAHFIWFPTSLLAPITLQIKFIRFHSTRRLTHLVVVIFTSRRMPIVLIFRFKFGTWFPMFMFGVWTVGGGRLIKKWQQPPKTTKTFNVRPQPHNHRNTPHTHTA